MKLISTFFTGILLFSICAAQNTKTFTIPADYNILEVVPSNEVYLYPSFTASTVYFKNAGISHGKLNYNILLAEMQFIDDKGDTLSLSNAETIEFININQDTFYYAKNYLQKIEGNQTVKLVAQKMFSQVEKRKKGAYGETNSNAAITSYSSIITNGQVKNLTVQEDLILLKTANYYFGDRFNNFQLFNRKNLLKYFSRNENEIKAYIDLNKINFNKENDLRKLTIFLQTLK